LSKSELKTRLVALTIINKATSRDRRLSDVTAEVFRNEANNLDDQNKRFITMLVQGTVRLSRRLDWEIKQVFIGDYNDLKENIIIILRLGVYQLHYMDSVPDYAAVTTTVNLAKRVHKNLGGLANAILRTIIKENNKLIILDENTPIDIVSEYLSHPKWLINKWIKDYSFDDAKLMAEWNNKLPKIWFRVNNLEYSSTKFINYLKKHKIEFEQFKYIPAFITTSKNQELLKCDIFSDGKITVQDPSAGLVVQLVDPQKNESIVDICAAPGGKTSYMADKLDNTGCIHAFDVDQNRINRLEDSLNRLKITNTIIDLLNITKEKINMTDKMLIDVPCSGTGVMSKRADIRWRRSIDEILEMHLLQRKILWRASNYVNPNGVIIYSTCSIEPEENYMVIDAFLKSHPKYTIESAANYIPTKFVDERGGLFTFPPHHNIDGVFSVRLKHNG
jgi:16S rRNA (cytosine967-C5)-methyltransferase